MEDMVELERFAYTPMGTFGRLTVAYFSCFTVERPWVGNKPSVSCIPEGVYTLQTRSSGVVYRTTHGKYMRGWEITEVPEREYIMLHPGNEMDDLEGCVATGDELGFVNGKWAVLNSVATFEKLMKVLSAQDEWEISIRGYRPEWP